tara:strand:+ start:407 stop:772 length:366 start_codon:yes stop_codon:yes gene_type:complete
MSEETNDKGFLASVLAFFGSLTIKVKLILGTIIGVFGFISYFVFSKKKNNREILELELKKVREEIEIEKTQEEIDINNEKLIKLETRAEEIVEEIKKIEAPDPEREVSNEELDEFFDERGF